MDITERARLERGVGKVLAALRAAGGRGVLNGELVMQTGHLDAPRRARELRARGYVISVEPEGGGVWRYTLLEEPGQTPPDARLAREFPLRDDEEIDGLTQPSLFGGGGE